MTDALEIYIIEARKAKKYASSEKNTLNSWIEFINNPEVNVDMDNKKIKKAKKVLEEISQDEREQRLTELRQKYIMDQHSIYDAGYYKGIEAGIEKGIKKGIEQGIDQGIKQGTEQERIKIIKQMYAQKLEIEKIAEIMGVAEEEVNKIINQE